ncbi:MAG: redox-regulated ATPase YchF, partial [Deltaproteobacteria bacterium]|nr:redox-regulated ATPase YchF [Deltaproteobacteria bacterium]
AGIIGLPNVGKSTIFNALTRLKAPCSNYPFCTIEPHIGIVPISDKRLEALKGVVKPKEVIPASIEIVDIAGLVRGASKGEGLGNKFLSKIREVDALVHILRLFRNPDVSHVEGEADPDRDAGIVETELLLADYEAVSTRMTKAKKTSEGGDKDAGVLYELLVRLERHLAAGKPARTLAISEPERDAYRGLFLLTAKKVLFVGNTGEADIEAGSGARGLLGGIAARFDDRAMCISGLIEMETLEFSEAERADFLKEYGIETPAAEALALEVYGLLGLITFFTTQSSILQAWDIPAGTKAAEAAGKIHSDMEKGFIAADVIHYGDMIHFRDEAALKSAGKIASAGRDYVVKDGDIIKFKIRT